MCACKLACCPDRPSPAALPRPCPQVNYRTHSGILGVASAVVDVLKAFWPDSIDDLAREEAFFHVSWLFRTSSGGAPGAPRLPLPAGSHLAGSGWFDWLFFCLACPPLLQGPPPLALTALTAEDLALLLSWSDKDNSQVQALQPPTPTASQALASLFLWNFSIVPAMPAPFILCTHIHTRF